MDEYEFLEDENILIIKPIFVSRTQVPQKALYEKAHREMVDLIVKYGYPNVLADCRDVRMDFSLKSIIEKTDMWKRLEMSKNVKVACVLNKMHEAAKLRENRLQSYQYQVVGFTDYDKAMNWLLE